MRAGIRHWQFSEGVLPPKPKLSTWKPRQSDAICFGESPDAVTWYKKGAKQRILNAMQADVSEYVEGESDLVEECTRVVWNGMTLVAASPGTTQPHSGPCSMFPTRGTTVSAFYGRQSNMDVGNAVIMRIFRTVHSGRWFWQGMWAAKMAGSKYVGVYQPQPNTWDGHCLPLEYIIHDVMLHPISDLPTSILHPAYCITDLQGVLLPHAKIIKRDEENQEEGSASDPSGNVGNRSTMFKDNDPCKTSALGIAERRIVDQLYAQKPVWNERRVLTDSSKRYDEISPNGTSIVIRIGLHFSDMLSGLRFLDLGSGPGELMMM